MSVIFCERAFYFAVTNCLIGRLIYRKGGEVLNYDELYREYVDIVYRYLIGLSGNASLAEELTQETFFRAVKSKGFDGASAKASTWLCTIAKNTFLSYCRKDKHICGFDPEENDLYTEPDLLEDINCVEIYKSIHLLDEPYREIMLLKINSDMTFSQIGDVFGKSENWARVTYFRSKEKLRKIIRERNGEEI